MTPLEAAEAFAAALRRGDEETAAQLIAEFLRVAERLNRDIVRYLETAKTKSAYERGVRLEIIHAQVVAELETYAVVAARLITAEQRAAIGKAVRDAEAIFALAKERTTSALVAAASWNRAPIEALHMLVGKLADGSTLGGYLKRQAGESWDGMKREILHGLASGRNPRRTAAAVAVHLDGNLVSALTTSREAQVGTYNQASVSQYRANPGVVRGFIRLSALGPRTCPVCWALHGKFYALGEDFYRHLNCRCTTIPAVEGLPILIRPGEELFAELSRNEQRQILRPGEYERYASGDIRLADLVAVKHSPIWGPTLRRRSLAELDA